MHRIATRQKFSRKTKIFAEFLTKKNPFFFHQKIKNSKFLPKNSAKKKWKKLFQKTQFCAKFSTKKNDFFCGRKTFFSKFYRKISTKYFRKNPQKIPKIVKNSKNREKIFFLAKFRPRHDFFRWKGKKFERKFERKSKRIRRRRFADPSLLPAGAGSCSTFGRNQFAWICVQGLTLSPNFLRSTFLRRSPSFFSKVVPFFMRLPFYGFMTSSLLSNANFCPKNRNFSTFFDFLGKKVKQSQLSGLFMVALDELWFMTFFGFLGIFFTTFLKKVLRIIETKNNFFSKIMFF